VISAIGTISINSIYLKGFKVISYYNRDRRAKGSSSKGASISILIIKDLGVLYI
jgi:hypothetical protein